MCFVYTCHMSILPSFKCQNKQKKEKKPIQVISFASAKIKYYKYLDLYLQSIKKLNMFCFDVAYFHCLFFQVSK